VLSASRRGNRRDPSCLGMTPSLCRDTREDATFGGRRKASPTRVRRVTAIVVGLASVWASTAGPVLSAPATPSSIPTPACDLPVRTPDEIAALLAASGVATPAATTGGKTIPTGVPADAEMITAMEHLVHFWLACQNAGEPLRAWSLFSDGYLYRLLSRQGGLTAEAYQALATPAPVAEEAARVVAIEGERLLPDGRYGATVALRYPSVPMPKRFFFFFTQVDDRLLIDGILGEISFSVP
jgi:hypothetical protein